MLYDHMITDVFNGLKTAKENNSISWGISNAFFSTKLFYCLCIKIIKENNISECI